MSDLTFLFKLLALTHKHNQVKRALYAVGEDRAENDSEHSYQIALTAWYIIQLYKIDLNIDKVIRYALVHDLVEVYAGDVDARFQTPEVVKLKKEKEYAALLRLREEFSEFPGLTETIEQYEAKADPESLFVNGVDKILPPLNSYLGKGRIWKEQKYSIEEELVYLEKKVSHPELQRFVKEFIELLKANPDMFIKKSYEEI